MLKLIIFLFSVYSNAGVQGLHANARKGNLEGVKSFLASGIDIDSNDELGITTLDHAVRGGNINLVRFLVENSPLVV